MPLTYIYFNFYFRFHFQNCPVVLVLFQDCLNSFLSTFPVAFLGSSSTKTTPPASCLYLAIWNVEIIIWKKQNFLFLRKLCSPGQSLSHKRLDIFFRHLRKGKDWKIGTQWMLLSQTQGRFQKTNI